MRIPRIRFTLNALIIIIAFIAANCFAFRLVETNPSNLNELFLGALPLLNLALIGTLRSLSGQIRLRRTPPAPRLHCHPPAFTYFCLNFLTIGVLITLLIPNTALEAMARSTVLTHAFDALENLNMSANDLIVSLSTTLPETALNVADTFADLSFYFTVISAPPLLLAFIGHVLASRYAAKVSIRRFQLTACLVTFAFACIDLSIGLTLDPFEEEQTVTLAFQLIDQTSRQPIPAAELTLLDPFAFKDNLAPPLGGRCAHLWDSATKTSSFQNNTIPPKATANSQGRALLIARFTIKGQRNAFQSFSTFSPWGFWLQVSAPAYGKHNIPLSNLLGDIANPTRPVQAIVPIAHAQTTQDRFQDIAGIYMHPHLSWFQFEPDGRFAWYAPGRGGYSFGEEQGEEYGYLEWQDGILALTPIPRPGTPTHPQLERPWRPIKWDDRLYLVINDDANLQNFIRQALTRTLELNPLLPGAGPHYSRTLESETTTPILLRSPPEHNPSLSLPQLPAKVWINYFVTELQLAAKPETWYRSLQSLINPSAPANS